jgi:putative two-component system response regulator
MVDALEATRKHTVLVVDDSKESLQVLNEVLGDRHQVRLASNGEQALRAANQAPKPDVILLDIMMPGMDGYEVCRQLKSNSVTADIPVIFLTGKTRVEDAQRGFDLGCVDYITKPILPPIVIARVRTHVALKLAREFINAQSGI